MVSRDSQFICQYCKHPVKYPKFNFCTHCGKRIIDSRNTDSVDELVQKKINKDNLTFREQKLRNGGFLICDRCKFPNIYKNEDKFCCMCGYSLKIEENNNTYSKEKLIKNEIGIDNVSIDLGRFKSQYLEYNEVCLFQQEDVCWYEYTTNYRDQLYFPDGEPNNIWNSRAAGTLYLTNKKVILYDRGFSNIWTKLSIEGDFPEQIMCFPLEEINNFTRRVNLGNSGLVGIQISTRYGDYILAPSHRKYRGRRTPRMNEYSSLQTFCDKVSRLLNY